MGSTGCSTSAAKVSIKTGVKDPGMRVIVENGKRISIEELKRDWDVRGPHFAFFNSRRPAKSQIH